jgi:arsenate reductase (thioredoxin)
VLVSFTFSGVKPTQGFGQGVVTAALNILRVTDVGPRVLFVCVHNAGRSQMAAALFNRHARGRASADSAGTRPATHVHPEVVDVMREIGINLGDAKPRLLTAGLAADAVRVITMGCAEECPVVSAPVEDWGLPDPTGQPLDAVRGIRDDIDRRVRSLLLDLEV